jgi:hypothetical protein
MDENWQNEDDIMVVVVVELHSSWKWIVLTKLQLNCNELHGIYTINHATCSITLIK